MSQSAFAICAPKCPIKIICDANDPNDSLDFQMISSCIDHLDPALCKLLQAFYLR